MEDLKLTQKFSVLKPKDENMYPITQTDWDRLKNLVKQIVPYSKVIQVLGSILIGSGVSAVYELISLSTATNVSNWVIPTTWSILICSLIIGISLFVIDKKQKNVISYSKKNIEDEMALIESKYFLPEAPEKTN